MKADRLNKPFICLQTLPTLISPTCLLAHHEAVFYNFPRSDSEYSALLLALEWLERHCFNGTKVQWFSLMHGNGCQQAFSCCSTIRALSLVDGWLASHRTELQCCQVSHITYEAGSTYPLPKYQGWYWHRAVNAHCIQKSVITDWWSAEWMSINLSAREAKATCRDAEGEQGNAAPLAFLSSHPPRGLST